MAISTSYICDMCKAESNTSDEFWTLKLTMHPLHIPSRNRAKTFHACRKCAEQFGMLPYVSTPKPEEPPSIEDLIREVMSRLTD